MVKEFKANGVPIISIVAIPNQEQIVTGSADGVVRFWNFKTGQLLFSFVGDSKGGYVTWTPQGKMLAHSVPLPAYVR